MEPGDWETMGNPKIMGLVMFCHFLIICLAHCLVVFWSWFGIFLVNFGYFSSQFHVFLSYLLP